MLADGGRYKGKQVIARSAVEALLSYQTAHAVLPDRARCNGAHPDIIV